MKVCSASSQKCDWFVFGLIRDPVHLYTITIRGRCFINYTLTDLAEPNLTTMSNRMHRMHRIGEYVKFQAVSWLIHRFINHKWHVDSAPHNSMFRFVKQGSSIYPMQICRAAWLQSIPSRAKPFCNGPSICQWAPFKRLTCPSKCYVGFIKTTMLVSTINCLICGHCLHKLSNII